MSMEIFCRQGRKYESPSVFLASSWSGSLAAFLPTSGAFTPTAGMMGGQLGAPWGAHWGSNPGYHLAHWP